MSLYNRRRRLLTELAIVVLGTINAGLIINYCVQVRRAPVAPQWLDEGDRFLPAKRGAIALYGLPPLATLMIALVDMGAYWFLDVPLKYAVVLTSIFVPGWITVATLWVLCHYLSAANITDPFNYCYASFLNVKDDQLVDVSSALLNAAIFITVLLVITYTFYLIIATREFRRKGGDVFSGTRKVRKSSCNQDPQGAIQGTKSERISI